MAITQIPFAGGAYNMPSTQLDAQTCINWYTVSDSSGKYQTSLSPRPGLSLVANDSNEYSTRGQISLNGILYAVIDNHLYAIYSDGSRDLLGTLNTSSGWVKIITNDFQLLVTDGQYGYVYQIIATDVYDEGMFFQITEASSIIGEPVFSGTGINDLSVSGKYIGNISTTYSVQIDSDAVVIGKPVFTGTGVNDLGASGEYSGLTNITFTVQIDSIGILPGAPDTFKWSTNGGTSWSAVLVPMTGKPQVLLNGFAVAFGSTYSHTIGDTWAISITVPTSSNTFRWSDNGGSTWNGVQVVITGKPQKLSNGVSISFASIVPHKVADSWTIPIEVESSFFAPVFPAAQDGYGIYPMQNSNRIYISAINDFNSVDPLDFQNANVYPDNNVGSISVNQEVYIIKEQTIEVWNNVGTSSNIAFPFKPRSNFVINYGCEAAFTIAAGSSNIIFMLARNKNGARMVIMIENYNAKVISTEPLNAELRSYPVVSDAMADIIEINNHIFYYITFPAADKTWVYDLTMDMWSQWTSQINNVQPLIGYRWGRYRGNFHSVFNGMNVVGDSRTGKILKLDQTAFMDYDVPIEYERVASHFSADNEWVTINKLMIDMERGVATPTGQGQRPMVMLQISRDGGKTWGSELWRDSGKQGEYSHRALWYQLGTSRQFTFKLRCTDPVYNVVLGAVADIEASE